MAPLSPAISINICSTGWSLLIVVSKSWIENRNAIRTKNPNRELNPTLETTPIGALQLAFFVSSERCAEASKPVKVYLALYQCLIYMITKGANCR